MSTIKGVLIIVAVTNALAMLLAALFSSPLPLLSSFWQNFSFMLFLLSVFLFAISGVGGFRRQTSRLPGDRDPSHYRQDTWSGSGGINTEGPAFLMAGAVVILESLALALIFI